MQIGVLLWESARRMAGHGIGLHLRAVHSACLCNCVSDSRGRRSSSQPECRPLAMSSASVSPRSRDLIAHRSSLKRGGMSATIARITRRGPTVRPWRDDKNTCQRVGGGLLLRGMYVRLQMLYRAASLANLWSADALPLIRMQSSLA